MKIFAAAFIVATLAGFGAANASMPLAPAGVATNSDIIQVADGCGRGYFRGPHGRCHPIASRGFVSPPIIKRHCPPGYRLTPRGHCRPAYY
jgi:hypothetical protein